MRPERQRAPAIRDIARRTQVDRMLPGGCQRRLILPVLQSDVERNPKAEAGSVPRTEI